MRGKGLSERIRRRKAAAEFASETESGATRGGRERQTSVSSHIVGKDWELAAERFLVKETRRKLNDPRRGRWKTIMDVPWWMTDGGEHDLENQVSPNEVYPWNPAGGVIELIYVMRNHPRMPDEEFWQKDSTREGPWDSGG